ncbi:MAG TPA: nuclear transport factor 2 family protein [Pyrinomonadaceae bacterium]|nr:nuclear transport factor 2 family protein [Pyrinomonadaceae bacterium]
MRTLLLAMLIMMGVGIVLGQKKSDRDKIIETVGNIFSGADERDWQKVQRAMAGEVYLDYTSLAGGSPATLSPTAIVESWKGVLPGFRSTHHQIGNFKVKVEGDRAEANFSGLALHYLNGETWTVVGTYDFSLVKGKSGEWAVERMKLNLQKQDGNLQLPALAAQNVRNGMTFKAGRVSRENAEAVESFFNALEKLDIGSFMDGWAEGARQVMPLSPEGFPRELNGKGAILNQYKGLPENYTSMRFPRRIFATEDPRKVIVQYHGIIPLKDGSEYNNNYVGIFEIKGGKVERFTEYFDPFILSAAFGQKLQQNFNVSDGDVKGGTKTGVRRVEFQSEGLVLVGHLHLPAGFSEDKKHRAVVVTGSWTTVKEQMADLYASKLAREGLVALTFDFRNYGESEGQPRDYESPEMKARDITSAVDYLKSLRFVDAGNIGGLAVCASTGYMSQAVAQGADIKALNFVAPWLHNPQIARGIYGEENAKSLIAKSDAARRKFAETGVVDYVVAASDKDATAAMYGPFDYYLNPKRGAIKQWGNRFAVMAWKGWLEFDATRTAEKINIPVQIIHSRAAAVPHGAELYYSKLRSPKNIVWVEKATQFDFYDGEQLTGDAVKESVRWFGRHLN